MPSERAYQYSVVDMKLVMSNPEEFIIPENGMIYYNDMYYQAHMRYKEQQEKKKIK